MPGVSNVECNGTERFAYKSGRSESGHFFSKSKANFRHGKQNISDIGGEIQEHDSTIQKTNSAGKPGESANYLRRIVIGITKFGIRETETSPVHAKLPTIPTEIYPHPFAGFRSLIIKGKDERYESEY